MKPWLSEQGKAAFYRQIAQADSKFTDEFQDKLGEIKLPVLILWGEEDQWISSEQAYLLNSKIKGSKVVIVPNSGHLVIEEEPSVLITEILNFLGD